jgi:hypothetical protein
LPGTAHCPFGGACHKCPAPRVQVKLKIGQRDYKYEQEADRVAEMVMIGSDNIAHNQLACSTCNRKEAAQRKPHAKQITPLIPGETGAEELIQTKQSGNQTPRDDNPQTKRLIPLWGSGHPLPKKTRDYFETRFNYDFRKVRIYSNKEATQFAAALNARAFTLGNHIVFGSEQYQPDVQKGQRLLAHELTHVVQQSGGTDMFQLLSWSNNGVDFDSTITMRQLIFNAGPGRVGIDPGRIIASVSQGSPQQWLRFYSGSTATGAQPGAWHFAPEHQFSFSAPSAVQPSGHYIGFVQTAGRMHYGAQYENIAQPFAATVTNARDANDPGVPAPWYNYQGQRSGPVDLWDQQAFPDIFDMPTTILRVWGHQSAAQNPLRTVTAEGTFYIWLVVKHQNDPGNQINSLSFLYHVVVEYNRSWAYSGSGSPYDRANPANYQATGNQQINSQGEGGGSHTPVLTGLIANVQIDQLMNQWSFPGP